MKILMKNGLLYDGTGGDPFRGDLLINEDRIARVASQIDTEADLVLDLNGLSVAPGLIDGHSHNDWFAIKKDPLPYFEPFIRQGITTFVCGNCGVSEVGFDADSPHVNDVGAGLFSFSGTTGRYGSVSALFDAVDHRMPCNMAELAGHCTARAAVASNENRPLTPEEEAKMLSLLEKSLQEGAAGLSLGLMYLPGKYAGLEELKKVAALCVKYDRPLTVHPRAESKVSMDYPLVGRAHILRALDELKEIAAGTALKLQYSHFIFVGRNSFRYKKEALRILEDIAASGADVMFDIYNETLGVSVITVILPAWYQGLTPRERRKPVNRLKLAVLVKATSRLLGFGFQDIQVAYIGPGYEKYEGKTVSEVARMEGLNDLDAYLMLCEKSGFNGRVNMGPYTTPEIIHEFEKDDRCLFITDAWVEDHGVQNPAIYDCYPKFLRDSLLGLGDTMPKCVRRMTGAIADRFQLRERGYLKEGFFADLTVFDEQELKAAVPDREKAFGIRKVFINGVPVLDGDKLDREALKTSGRALRVV